MRSGSTKESWKDKRTFHKVISLRKPNQAPLTGKEARRKEVRAPFKIFLPLFDVRTKSNFSWEKGGKIWHKINRRRRGGLIILPGGYGIAYRSPPIFHKIKWTGDDGTTRRIKGSQSDFFSSLFTCSVKKKEEEVGAFFIYRPTRLTHKKVEKRTASKYNQRLN